MPRKQTSESIYQRINELNIGVEMVGEYLGTAKKTLFRHSCGYEWETLPKSLLRGSGCQQCGWKRLDTDKINLRLLESNPTIKLIGEYKNSYTKTLFRHECGHEWLAKPDKILKGNGCPLCSDTKLTVRLIEVRLLESNPTIKLIGEYKNSYTKTLFRHECGHEWLAKPSHVLGGSGCPVCSRTGFNPTKQAWEYMFIRDDYLKYGITNDLRRRLREHRRHGEFVLIHERRHDDGSLALEWENKIKSLYGGSFVSKEKCPDGYTETLPTSLASLLMG